MIQKLVFLFTILGFGAYLRACPVSGTPKSLDSESLAGYGTGLFQSNFEGSASTLLLEEFPLSYSHSNADAGAAFDPVKEQSPEFLAPALIPEVVRIVLMGSGLICLAGLWQRRENRRLSRFV